jgi:hypothetical protein
VVNCIGPVEHVTLVERTLRKCFTLLLQFVKIALVTLSLNLCHSIAVDDSDSHVRKVILYIESAL